MNTLVSISVLSTYSSLIVVSCVFINNSVVDTLPLCVDDTISVGYIVGTGDT